MQALIDFIIRNLLALWPIAKVYTWEQGLMIHGGIVTRELQPGLHWRWWFIEEVRKWPSNIMAADLQTAAVTTTDGVPVAISANMVYRMTSIRLMWLGLFNTEASLKNIALGVIASECAKESWDALRADRSGLESRLVTVLGDRVRQWGICIDRIHLTDLVQARPHRHYVEGMKT